MQQVFLFRGADEETWLVPSDFEALITRLTSTDYRPSNEAVEQYWLSQTQRIDQIKRNMGLDDLGAKVFLVLFYASVIKKAHSDAHWNCDVPRMVACAVGTSYEHVYGIILQLEHFQIFKYDEGRKGGDWRIVASVEDLLNVLEQRDWLEQENRKPLNKIYSDYSFSVVSLLSSGMVYFESSEKGATEIDLSLLGPAGAMVLSGSKAIALFRSKCLNIVLHRLSQSGKALVITLHDHELDVFFQSGGRRNFFGLSDDDDDQSSELFDDDFLPLVKKFNIGLLVVRYPSPTSLRQARPKGLMSVFPVESDSDKKRVNPIEGLALSHHAVLSLSALAQPFRSVITSRLALEHIPSEDAEQALQLLSPKSLGSKYDQAPRGAGNLFSFECLNVRGMSGNQLKDRLEKLLERKNKHLSRNFIFVGPPGCGKSSLAFGLVKKEEICIIKGGGASGHDSYVNGVGARVTHAFAEAQSSGKRIVLIDDASSLFYARSGSGSRRYDAAETDTLLGLLESDTGLMVIVTLNSLEGLDEAVLDRFAGNIVHFENPTVDQSLNLVKEIWSHLHPEYPFSDDDQEQLEKLRSQLGATNHRLISNTLNHSEAPEFSDFIASLVLAIKNSRAHKLTNKGIGFRDSA